jgi:amidase
MSVQLDPFSSAVDLAEAIRRKEVSPVEVVDMYLARIDELDPELNAFCHRADDDVRKAASVAADAVVNAASVDDLPAFHGVPLPIKDFLDVAGWPTTYGSTATSRTPATTSDLLVQRFVAGGFVPLGKTTTSEFASVPFTESEALGISRNPWDLSRTPGGSSSGSGAAVAAGLAPIAHAADGGGSIRIPASCNGLVGLKPTRGLITGSTVEAEGLGTHGVLTRTVADTAAALDVLARHDPGAWWSPPTPSRSFACCLDAPAPTRLRIGVMADSPVEGIGVDPACVTAVEDAGRILRWVGNNVVDTTLALPPIDELIGAFTMIWNVASAGIPIEHVDRIEPHNRALREAARAVDSWTYVEAVHRTQQLSRHITDAFLADFDLLITPTMACLPPLVGTLGAGVDENPMMPVLNSYPMGVFSVLFNVTGQPAISVPTHVDEATGLPVGIQIVAAPWREDLLLRVARTLEIELPWADRRPAIS